MNKSPIFIHSLFRSGSTYLFNVFRRSGKYWCYQEPLHEIVLWACDNPELLLKNLGEEKMHELRHPQLEKPYFQELYDTWPVWKDTLSTVDVFFNNYFSPPNADIGITFWRTLIDAAHGRPVFQECRTSGRIGEIKRHLGGYHIYLWRNPWDQWLSYKIDKYFNMVVNQLIINAFYAPVSVQALRRDLQFEVYSYNDLADAISYFSAKPLSAEQSYLIFYMLWCLGLQEGWKHAHIMLNIDGLSDSSVYRDEIKRQLESAGIENIDFSDCHIFQSYYTKEDRDFFQPLEEKVYTWLREGGWSQADIDRLQDLRVQFQPVIWKDTVEAWDPLDFVEQMARMRVLARCFETQLAEISYKAESRAMVADERAQQAESRAMVADERAQQAESRAMVADERAQQAESRAMVADERAQQAESRAMVADERAQQAESRAMVADERAQQAESRAMVADERAQAMQTQLTAVYNSISWRITRPLRTPPVRFIYRQMVRIREQGLMGRMRFICGNLAMMAASRCIDFIESHSRLYDFMLKWIHRLGLYERVRMFYRRYKNSEASVATSSMGTQYIRESNIDVDIQHLSPRARQIYFQIKGALARHAKDM